MKKPKAKKQKEKLDNYMKWYYMVPVAAALVIIILYLGRGWIRHTMEPAALSITGGSRLQAELEKQISALGNPFSALGIDNTQESKLCSLAYAHILHSEVYCSAEMVGYSKISAVITPSLAERSANLEQALKDNGWQAGNTTISELGANIGKGIDYTPDAAYIKKIGSTLCMLDFNTAFSHPQPAAINGSVSCQKNFGIFGSAPSPTFLF